MAERQQNLLHSLGLGLCFGVTVQDDVGCSGRGIVDDLDVLHRGGRPLRSDTERLEDSLLSYPASSVRRRRRGLRIAVRNLSIGEVASDEGWVVRRNRGDQLYSDDQQ